MVGLPLTINYTVFYLNFVVQVISDLFAWLPTLCNAVSPN